MTTWSDLRTGALLGTRRRPLVLDAVAGHPLPADLDGDAERRLLAAAALLGARRRVGRPAHHARTPSPAGEETRAEAPPAATQLLDLILSGSLGRPTTTDPLLAQWLHTAAQHDRRAPAPLVVGVLQRATANDELRTAARAAVGQLGRWLGAQREDWSWVRDPIGEPDRGPLVAAELAEPFQLASGARRMELLSEVRRADPSAGRALAADALTTASAAERAALLGALRTGLGDEDEPLLDQALDDKAKSVREAGAALLDALPASRRARRLAAVLEPLISVRTTGLVRRTATIALAPLGDEDLARDLPGVAATARRAALVRAAPLSTWSERTGLEPSSLLAATADPPDLRAWWAAAAVAQAEPTWARAVGVATGEPSVLRMLPGPWDQELTEAVIEGARRSAAPALAVSRVEDLLAARGHPATAATLSRWADALDAEADRPLRHRLAGIARTLSTRSSITEAFA